MSQRSQDSWEAAFYLFLLVIPSLPFLHLPSIPFPPSLFSHFFIGFTHRLIKITDRTPGVVFSRFMCVSFTITLRQKPKGVTHSLRRTELQDRDCERNTHKSKKTTSSVLSVILINLWLHLSASICWRVGDGILPWDEFSKSASSIYSTITSFCDTLYTEISIFTL